ncbi:prolyl aminopeptidase [Amycolatopsis viridis]|uniref:Proline iminopeptidase n=1 Tax=Amycolatopsis viridis TaxID=185678 RepID=A0ABX0SUI4_9PSEU|nr:prolyl aminopeptidase [Amycolatopsis viridis]NIH79165.1 proline iminopeptidase [Amycolatopsis viridis]
MTQLHPTAEPYAEGMLDVGDGNRIHWAACGNPDGKPAAVVHGGPGSGAWTSTRGYFDPDRYHVVLFDQRNCGRSTPHASDPATDLTHNTTEHLIADMELLREHLGIDRWLLFGGSWGSTLILAYAQRHPERVSEIVIAGVTTTDRRELEWLYHEVGRFFPAERERFRAGAGDVEGGTFDVLAAYARLLADPDPAVRAKAARDWSTWEDTAISLEPHGVPNVYSNRPSREVLAITRICAHYFSNAAWLTEGVLIREAHRLKGIPGKLIHGRLDLSGPVETAWELAKVWPDADLQVIEDAGHTGSDAMRAAMRAALDEFAVRPARG